jgi:hypothetical protein
MTLVKFGGSADCQGITIGAVGPLGQWMFYVDQTFFLTVALFEKLASIRGLLVRERKSIGNWRLPLRLVISGNTCFMTLNAKLSIT